MAEYEPFPTGANEIRSDRDLAKRVLGCFGLGGLGVLGAVIAVGILVAGLASFASGCDFELGDPGDGKDSQRLAVRVTPRTDLGDATTVRVTSDAFEGSGIVGVAVCLRSADTERRGVEACDEIQGARYATGPNGGLDATYTVPRVITVGGKAYDCATQAERCLVVAADADDYDESGGQPISFRADLGPADLVPVTERVASDHLPIGADPSVEGTSVAPGTPLKVLASGFQPNEPLLLASCTPDLDDVGVIEACDPVDSDLAFRAVALRTLDGDFPRADASGAFTATVPAEAVIAPIGGDIGKAASEYGRTTTTTDPHTTTSTTRPLREGEVRCTEDEGGCVLVVAAAADTKRSAVLPYTVTG